MDKAPQQTRSIVVGVDGSASAARALHWAALEASRTRALLHVVNVWSVPVTAYGVSVAAFIDPADMEAGANTIVRRAQRAVRRELGVDAPAIDVHTINGSPAEALIDVSHDATMLVVGTRGRGGFASLVLGSVATKCAHHSVVPVVIVGVDAPEPGQNDIVVGFDDSEGARSALGWAAEEALAHGVALRVVHGWDPPLTTVGPTPSSVHPGEPATDDQVRVWLERSVATETEGWETGPSVTVTSLAQGASEALLQEAKSAGLLVVGARGRGGFLGLVLGSVSAQCLHHSPCPIVIVPAAHPADAS